MKVTLLGVGLIGGSIGLAARARGGASVVGYDPDPQALEHALERGAIDKSAIDLAGAVAGADVVFVAVPVGSATSVARLALESVSSECVVSDVGSTKRKIAHAVSDPRFVGGHPLAGAETAGVANAREDLFDGATWYLTPLVRAVAAQQAFAASPPSAGIERLRALIECVGACPVTIDPEDHDRLMANVSHLPHVLANVLVAQAMRALVSDEPIAEDSRLDAGPSFRDATRVAGANTAVWTDIYMANGDLIADALDESIEELSAVRDALDSGDADAIAAWNERVCDERTRLAKLGAFGAGTASSS